MRWARPHVVRQRSCHRRASGHDVGVGRRSRIAAVLLFVGCGERALGGESEHAAASSGDAETGIDAPYPYCEWTDRGPAAICPDNPTLNALLLWNVEGDASSHCDGERESCNTCLCAVTCSESKDGPRDPAFCPVPTSGTA